MPTRMPPVRVPMAMRATATVTRGPVIFGEPDVEAVAGEVGHVAGKADGLGVHRFTGDDPADVRPPGAFLRSVRVAGVVAVLVMDAVGADPADGSAFERECAADGKEVLDNLRHGIAAVGEQAVIAHADAEVDREDIERGGDNEIGPS